MKEIILKVNPEKNIEELGKYLHKVNILGAYEGELEGVYACITDTDDIENSSIDRCFVNFYINKDGEIDYCTFEDNIDWDVVLPTIYDLVKADLLVKEVR